MYTGEVVMDLDRGTLARIDRKLVAGLGQNETFRMVRMPVSDAKWATWKSYCETAGILDGPNHHDADRPRAGEGVW